MEIQQFVLAYQAEQDRLRALLPAGVESLRPVLRINAELRGGPAGTVYLELNTPVAAFGKRGWWNVGRWESPAHPLTARQEGAACRRCRSRSCWMPSPHRPAGGGSHHLPGPLPHPHLHPNRGGGRLPGREGQRRLLLPPRGGAPLCPGGGHHRPSGLLRRGLPMGLCPRGCPGPQPEREDPAGLSHPAKGPVPPAAPDAPGRGGHSLPAGAGGLHRAVSAGGVRGPLETWP